MAGRQPQVAVGILLPIGHRAALESAGVLGIGDIARVGLSGWVEPIQPGQSTADEPEIAGAILKNTEDAIARETVRIAPVGEVAREGLSVRVELIRAATLGRDPDHPVLIFVEIVHPVIAQTIWVVGVVFVGGEAVAVIAAQTGWGADPHKATAILQNG